MIALEVNGRTRQSSDLGMLVWNIREQIADLSRFGHMQPPRAPVCRVQLKKK